VVDIYGRLVSIIQSEILPEKPDAILEDIYDRDAGEFSRQESLYWDYKRDFPFSMSDDYFGGFVRIVCAFYNTYGGFLFVGVHDTSRDPGHNKVPINIERLNNVL
jgi:predicted HTH transcriptional regulator